MTSVGTFPVTERSEGALYNAFTASDERKFEDFNQMWSEDAGQEALVQTMKLEPNSSIRLASKLEILTQKAKPLFESISQRDHERELRNAEREKRKHVDEEEEDDRRIGNSGSSKASTNIAKRSTKRNFTQAEHTDGVVQKMIAVLTTLDSLYVEPPVPFSTIPVTPISDILSEAMPSLISRFQHLQSTLSLVHAMEHQIYSEQGKFLLAIELACRQEKVDFKTFIIQSFGMHPSNAHRRM